MDTVRRISLRKSQPNLPGKKEPVQKNKLMCSHEKQGEGGGTVTGTKLENAGMVAWLSNTNLREK